MRDIALRDSNLVSALDITRTISSLDDSSRRSDNPLQQGLPLKSKNIFIDVCNFALAHNKELLYTILCLTTDRGSVMQEATVISTAKVYMDFASRGNSYKNSTFKKLQGVVLQSCGLSETGIDSLARLGESISKRTLLRTKAELAIFDEKNIKEK